MMQNLRNTYIQIKQNISALRHYFTSSNCIFMQLQGIVFIRLQGIVFIRLQGNDILVNYEGNTDSFKERIFIHKKYNHSRQLYSNTKLYSFQGTLYLFGQGNISSFNENIFIQESYIHSRKYAYLRNIYSFKFKAIYSFKETIFIEHCCIRGIAEIFIQKLSPATL